MLKREYVSSEKPMVKWENWTSWRATESVQPYEEWRLRDESFLTTLAIHIASINTCQLVLTPQISQGQKKKSIATRDGTSVCDAMWACGRVWTSSSKHSLSFSSLLNNLNDRLLKQFEWACWLSWKHRCVMVWLSWLISRNHKDILQSAAWRTVRRGEMFTAGRTSQSFVHSIWKMLVFIDWVWLKSLFFYTITFQFNRAAKTRGVCVRTDSILTWALVPNTLHSHAIPPSPWALEKWDSTVLSDSLMIIHDEYDKCLKWTNCRANQKHSRF